LKMLTLVLSVLSLSNCTPKPPLDSFCVRYNPVVVEKGDGSAVASMKKDGPKRRIYANELNYRECPVKR
jgi:hypothetical protein